MSRLSPNKAPAPNRRPRFPLGALSWFVYLFCAPPAGPAAVGEAQRSICMHAPLILALLCGIICATSCAPKGPQSIYEAKARARLEALTANQLNVQFLQSVRSLPVSVREKLGPIADAGHPFSTGCTGSDPHRRFLAATQAGGTYTIAVEQGGYVYTWFTIQYVVNEAGKILREGQIERGASDGSQPFGSGTNQTPGAAGSRR